MYYIANIAKEGEQWLVDFPDCPGCQTYGNTKAEAAEMAAEALEGWLEVSLEHGDVLPRPPRVGVGLAVKVPQRLATAIAIRWLRADHNLTQGQLAKLIGVTQQAVAKLERPSANPSIDTLDKIASGLDADIDFKFVPRQPPTTKTVRTPPIGGNTTTVISQRKVQHFGGERHKVVGTPRRPRP